EAAEEQFPEAAGFRLFHIKKGFFGCPWIRRATQTKLNEPLINLLPIFHESNLNFFATQATPKPFEGKACGLIRVVSRFQISFSFLYVPCHQMRLIVHHGSI